MNWKTCIFMGLFIIAGNAQAEYYLVYPAAVGYVACCGHVEHHSARHKHGKYSISIYEPCPCAYQWIPGHCNDEGDWIAGQWQPREVETTYITNYTYYPNDGYTYDHDMATGDDDVMDYPDMNGQY
jgi:hypothetical protein